MCESALIAALLLASDDVVRSVDVRLRKWILVQAVRRRPALSEAQVPFQGSILMLLMFRINCDYFLILQRS
jgi:hypothetical protein